VLDKWTDAECNALMRRGVFAPSTYGRIRFHQRSTQEYLTARWLDRQLRAGWRAEVWELVFAERYGIETLVPSLHATAAWLALDHQDIRDEIIRREPLVLLRHGDPRSLPLGVKERLLLTYARRHATGEISDDSLDHRALWMFATSDLANAIRESWAINTRQDFHVDLLRLVREGAIQPCVDLARGVVLDETADDYLRIVALQALDACGDTEGLVAAARCLRGASGQVSTRLGPSFAKVLFPRHLTVDELLDLIERSPPPRHNAVEGFGYALGELWKLCPDIEAQERLLAGLAALSLAPPFEADYRRISARHHELARKLAPLTHEAVLSLGDAEPSVGLVRMLMAVERTDRHVSGHGEEPPLGALVSGNARLQRRLFWGDVEETRQNASRGEDRPTQIWHVHISGGPLWQLGPKDLAWLFEDLSGRALEADKRIALSGVFTVLRSTGGLDAEMPRLRALVAGHAELERDLESYLAPPTEDEETRRFRHEERRYQHARDEEERKDKESWVKFRNELKAEPSLLRDPTRLTDWATGAARLYHLNRWLCHKTKKDYADAARQWRLLEEVFGRPVAEAYRDGMKALWRVTPPERPMHKKGGGAAVKRTTVLSLAGLGVEAAEDPDWASRLSTAEAERAAQHACLSEQGYADWIEALVDGHPAIVPPILRRTLLAEWSGSRGGRTDFFSHYSWVNRPIQPSIQQILFAVITGKKPKAADILDRGLRVLQRLDLNERQCRQAAALALRRLRAARTAGDDERVRGYLAMLFLVDTDRATQELVDWLDAAPATLRQARAEGCLGALFERHSPLAAGMLDRASVASLEALVRLAYRHVRPEDDRTHERAYTPDARDNAEGARSTLLHALLKRPGADAYRAMRAFAADPAFPAHAIRFNELARGKAERDAEPPPWTPADVVSFEQRHIAPAKTGEALLHVVMSVLSEIQSSFRHADATSSALLEHAKNEGEVQGWLAEQMNLRSRGRFHAHRESQVAHGDKPDIIVASTAAKVEVAVEVKHSGKGSTVRKLERALTKQLADNYLKPATRRHGVLVVSHHGRRTWRDPATRVTLNFRDLIKRLQTLAATVVRDEFGAVEVRTCGIDASEPGDATRSPFR